MFIINKLYYLIFIIYLIISDRFMKLFIFHKLNINIYQPLVNIILIKHYNDLVLLNIKVFLYILYIIILFYYLLFTSKNQPIRSLSYSMILGGGIGNLYDIIIYGYIIDFFDIHILNYHFIMNIADIYIFIGIILLIIIYLRMTRLK